MSPKHMTGSSGGVTFDGSSVTLASGGDFVAAGNIVLDSTSGSSSKSESSDDGAHATGTQGVSVKHIFNLKLSCFQAVTVKHIYNLKKH